MFQSNNDNRTWTTLEPHSKDTSYKNCIGKWISLKPQQNSMTSQSVVSGHLVTYMLSGAQDYQWCFGLTLMRVFIVRIISGMILVSEPQCGIGLILSTMTLSSYGQIAPGVHGIGSSQVRAVRIQHILRALLHGSSRSLLPVYSLGILIMTLSVAACFLGYSTTYGARAHWALRVVQGLMRCLPLVDMWFYGNYIVTYNMLAKCLVFHFIIVIITFALMAIHIIRLHSSGSSSGVSMKVAPGYNASTVDLYFHVIIKDLQLVSAMWIIFGALLRALQLVRHTDNNIIINAANPTQL